MKFSDLCTPAALYLVLSVISTIIIIFARFRFISIVIKILFVLAWTWVLNFLCKKGLTGISWILVILPYLIMFGVVAMILEFLKVGNNKFLNNIQNMMMMPVSSNPGNQIPTYNNSLPTYIGGGAVGFHNMNSNTPNKGNQIPTYNNSLPTYIGGGAVG